MIGTDDVLTVRDQFDGVQISPLVGDVSPNTEMVTIHFAEEQVDSGPPILQEPVPVLYGDSAGSLSSRIREVEHRLLPEAVRLFAAGRVERDPHRRRQVRITEENL